MISAFVKIKDRKPPENHPLLVIVPDLGYKVMSITNGNWLDENEFPYDGPNPEKWLSLPMLGNHHPIIVGEPATP